MPAGNRRNRQFALAVADLTAAAGFWPLWTRLGWNDILYRYRRSTLGPFWSTVNIAITVIALGLVYSQIFKLPIAQLMPYVCAGLIAWGFISSVMLDAGSLFSGSESYIKQMRLPYLLYVCRFVFGKVAHVAHDLPIYVILLFLFSDLARGCRAVRYSRSRAARDQRRVRELDHWNGFGAVSGYPPHFGKSRANPVSGHANHLDAGFAGSAIVSCASKPVLSLDRDRTCPVAWRAPVRVDALGDARHHGVNGLVASCFFLRFRGRIAYWV